MRACPNCGAENPETAQYCNSCGTSLSPAPTPASAGPSSTPAPAQSWTGPTTAPRPAGGNGLAVAALVVGIIGVLSGLIPLFFFFAFVLGALALIFGFIGRSRARERGTGKGQATAGIVLGALAIVLGVVGVVIVSDAFEDVDEALEDVTGEADEDDYELETGECTFDSDFGEAELTGTITNTSDETRGFNVEVEFLDSNGTRLERSSDFVTDLAPGQSSEWSVAVFDLDAAPACEVLGVDNF